MLSRDVSDDDLISAQVEFHQRKIDQRLSRNSCIDPLTRSSFVYCEREGLAGGGETVPRRITRSL